MFQVGFASFNLVDEGRTIIGKSARVAPGNHTKGVFHIMKTNPFGDNDPRLYSNVQTLTGATARWDLFKKFWRRGDGNNLVLSKVNAFAFHCLKQGIFLHSECTHSF